MSGRVRRVVMLLVMAAFAVGVGASRADAHALLLRSVPAGNTTVAAPPREVVLTFSEPVEAAFARLRVYDVDGHRVDDGNVRRTDGNTVLRVGVGATAHGTYTVTWQVTAGDGHTTSGGFEYYVVAPSNRSAVVVQVSGSNSVANWLEGFGRTVWFLGLACSVGAVVFRRWVWNRCTRSGALGGDTPGASDEADAKFRAVSVRLVVGGAVVGALGLVVVLWAQTALNSGESLAASLRWSLVDQVLRTNFGTSWLVTFAGVVLLLAATIVLGRGRVVLGVSPSSATTLAVVAGVLASIGTSLGGHARESAHPWLTMPATALHVAAMVAWVGGLFALATAAVVAWRLVPSMQRPTFVRALAAGFGTIALASVVVLAASGVVMAVWQITAVSELWQTNYGRILLAKLVLFALALVLAARHRWSGPARLSDDPERASTDVVGFERSSRVEAGLLVVVVALAAALVAQVPSRVAASRSNTSAAATTFTVGRVHASVFVDPSATGDNQLHLSFTTDAGIAAAGVDRVDVQLQSPSGTVSGIEMQLLGPGHFAGSFTAASPGRYGVRVSIPSNADSSAGTGTYSFTINAA